MRNTKQKRKSKGAHRDLTGFSTICSTVFYEERERRGCFGFLSCGDMNLSKQKPCGLSEGLRTTCPGFRGVALRECFPRQGAHTCSEARNPNPEQRCRTQPRKGAKKATVKALPGVPRSHLPPRCGERGLRSGIGQNESIRPVKCDFLGLKEPNKKPRRGKRRRLRSTANGVRIDTHKAHNRLFFPLLSN